MGNMLKNTANFNLKLQCFTANLRKRNDLYCAITNARLKSKNRRICMGNMHKNTANLKLKLHCFTANLRKRNVWYCAMTIAHYKTENFSNGQIYKNFVLTKLFT